MRQIVLIDTAQDKHKLLALLPDYVRVVEQVNDLTDELGSLVAEVANATGDRFHFFCVCFAQIAAETPDALLRLLREGHITQCVIILREYLELSSLFLYIWMNPVEFGKWAAGANIPAKQVREFLKSSGFATWYETYHDWSNFVHGNAQFVRHFEAFSQRNTRQESIEIPIGHVLMNTAYLNHKFNHILGKVVQESDQIEVARLNQSLKRYVVLEQDVMQLVELQEKLERRL